MCVMLRGEVDCVVLFGPPAAVGFKSFILSSIEIRHPRASEEALPRK